MGPNFAILDRTRIGLSDDVTLLGCTLHSYIPPESEEIVNSKVNDFTRIENWKVVDHVAEHHRDVTWLKNEIESISREEGGAKRKLMVATHHSPSVKGTSKPSDEGSAWSSAFVTNLLQQGNRSPLDDVQWWIFGHTHYTTQLTKGKVKLVSNQRGYVFPNAKPRVMWEKPSVVARVKQRLGFDDEKRHAFDRDRVLYV